MNYRVNRLIVDEMRSHQDEMIELALKLINFDTTRKDGDFAHPFGIEMDNALRFLLRHAKEYGLENVSNYKKFGLIDYSGSSSDIVMVLNHLDTVPIGAQWTRSPYGEIYNGYLYGRGAADNKAPLVASLFALITLKELGLTPRNTIRLFVGLDEETNAEDIALYKEMGMKYPVAGITPDAKYPLVTVEYSQLCMRFIWSIDDTDMLCSTDNSCNTVPDSLKIVRYGLNEVIKGKASHSAFPEQGVNAIHKFIRQCTLAEIIFGREMLAHLKNCMSYDLRLHITDGIEVVCTRLQVSAGHVELILDCRLNPSIVLEEAEEMIVNLFARSGIASEVIKRSQGYDRSEGTLKDLLVDNYLQHTFQDSFDSPLALRGGTYARYFDNVYPYGISLPDSPKSHAHSVDERIKIDKFLYGAEILATGIWKLSQYEVSTNVA